MQRLVRLTGPRQREYAKRLIDEAADGDYVTLSAPTRTLDQNAKLHPMLQDVLDQVPSKRTLSRDDLKLQFLNQLGVEVRFLPELEDGGGLFPVGLRSSTLTKEQFSALIDLVYEFGGRHGVRWSEPRREAA